MYFWAGIADMKEAQNLNIQRHIQFVPTVGKIYLFLMTAGTDFA